MAKPPNRRAVASVKILPPADALETLTTIGRRVTTTILDPWYNKGVGGARPDYDDWLSKLIHAAADISEHVFIWGFPEIVYRQADRLPPGFDLKAWLTWYYPNCPSVIQGWRSAQNTCLHFGKTGARIYPEHFLNEAQLDRKKAGTLRYMPGPPSVFNVPLNIGFVGRAEQTGHPSQKPIKTIEPLILMTTVEGDTVLDPMCGAGTTGAACKALRRNAILSDLSEDYTKITEKRLNTTRVSLRSKSSKTRKPSAYQLLTQPE
ncbi:MAG TPA: site-specific DNA-methyltransferase [Thermoguttaceae bacterium]